MVIGGFYTFFLLIAPRFCSRKFNPNTLPGWEQLCHDLWYWSLGVLQFTFWECLVVRAWATGRLAYLSDEELLSVSIVDVRNKLLSNYSGSSDSLDTSNNYDSSNNSDVSTTDISLLAYNLCKCAFWIAFAQAFRSLHFYLCHRMIHVRPFYKAFHGLHHRNTDVEPFSGLAMHPAEHLYYFTSIFIPLIFAGAGATTHQNSTNIDDETTFSYLQRVVSDFCIISPMVFRYAAYLPVLVPGASHSGFEDHHLSQQEHYIHHTTFNKNFGAGVGSYLDYIFDTYSDVVIGPDEEDKDKIADDVNSGGSSKRKDLVLFTNFIAFRKICRFKIVMCNECCIPA